MEQSVFAREETGSLWSGSRLDWLGVCREGIEFVLFELAFCFAPSMGEAIPYRTSRTMSLWNKHGRRNGDLLWCVKSHLGRKPTSL
jgi:hypothetical protein